MEDTFEELLRRYNEVENIRREEESDGEFRNRIYRRSGSDWLEQTFREGYYPNRSVEPSYPTAPSPFYSNSINDQIKWTPLGSEKEKWIERVREFHAILKEEIEYMRNECMDKESPDFISARTALDMFEEFFPEHK